MGFLIHPWLLLSSFCLFMLIIDPISRVSVVPNFDSHDNSVVSMKVYGNELYTSSSDKTTRAYNIQVRETDSSVPPPPPPPRVVPWCSFTL